MKDLLTTLKKLGKKMTGKDIAGKDLVQVVDNITKNYEGGSGGSGAFVIDVLDDGKGTENSFVIYSDEPAGSEYYTNLLNEAYAAAESGKPVMIRAYGTTDGITPAPTGFIHYYQLIQLGDNGHGAKSMYFWTTDIGYDWSQGSNPVLYVKATKLTFSGSRTLGVLSIK